MMKPILRPASLSDLPAIMHLENSGFEPGVVEETAVFESRLRHFPGGFFLLLDGEGNRPLGYATTEIWKGRHDFSPVRFELGHDLSRFHDPEGEELYLASMTVDPDCRGLGMGKVLFRETLSAMERGFPHLEKVILLVNETWQGARAIYRGHGFHDLAHFPGFFHPRGKPPQGAFVMGYRFR